MSIESDLRSVADALSVCRKRTLDVETNRILNWASMEVHNIARQLRRLTVGLADMSEEEVTDAHEERRFMGERRKATTAANKN